MVCDEPDSDNHASDFIESVAAWLDDEPREDYELLVGAECLGD